MKRGDQYIEPDNSYYKPSRDQNEGTMTLVVVITLLFVCLTGVLAAVYFKKTTAKETLANIDTTDQSGFISVASPTPTPMLPLADYQNPILYPATASVFIDPEAAVVSECQPSARGINETVMVNGSVFDGDYNRESQIYMGDPLYYGSIPGIFTYRGNNFRNCASYGYTNIYRGALTQRWEFDGIGTKLASTMNFEWSGVRWTGQPLVVEWPADVRQNMNMYDSAKQQQSLTEVIVAALDGKVYFFNLQNGEQTRDPIDVGVSIKGTPAVDPRGYPLLYVGQTDENSGNSEFGMRIFSLIDGSRLYYCNNIDTSSYRVNWGASDSSPIIDGASDTLIWPSENGFIYTFKLNTVYEKGSSSISINVEPYNYKYIFNDSHKGATVGVESSIAVYNGYGYFCDNDWDLICIDLNTFQMVWQFKLGDDSDISPMIEEENGIPYLYVSTEVDGQGGVVGEYSGAAYTYKFNGLTGELVWQTSQPCYTYNGETNDTDNTGGCLGNPISGKKGISDIVIFSYSRTQSLIDGNRLVAYDKLLGSTKWTYEMNKYTYSSPVDVYDKEGNGYILIGDSYGQIHLVDAQTGERITHILVDSDVTGQAVFEASAAVYGDTLVIGSKTGSIYAVKISHVDEQ